MTLEERQVRRKYRRLAKVAAHVPPHKKPLALAYAELASQSAGADERLALQRLHDLLPNTQDIHDSPESEIVTVLRSLDASGENESNYPSTPGGHPNIKQNPPSHNIYTPKHHTVRAERLVKPDTLWDNIQGFAQETYTAIREYRDASIDFAFHWTDLSPKERRIFSKALKSVYSKIDSIEWPEEEEAPPVPPGHVVCPGCKGSGHVLKSLKVALEWFLTRRAKVSRGTKRYKINPGDWGYEEIAAVELCDHYREKQQPLVEMIFETGTTALQSSKPTRLDPNAILVQRYPTAKQIQRGMLEIRAAQKKLSGVQAQQLKKLKREMVPGPKVLKNEKGLPKLDWSKKGVGCRVTHKPSQMQHNCEAFSNFKQNFAKAETELEKKVAKWIEEQESMEKQGLPQTSEEEKTTTRLEQ